MRDGTEEEPGNSIPTAAELGDLLRRLARYYGADAAADAVADLWQKCQNAGISVHDYRAYLETMAHRAVINVARRERRHQMAVEVLAHHQQHAPAPAARVEAAAMARHALRPLSPGQREIFVRVRGYGQSCTEAAADMGISPAAARQLLCRAEAKLHVIAAKLDREK